MDIEQCCMQHDLLDFVQTVQEPKQLRQEATRNVSIALQYCQFLSKAVVDKLLSQGKKIVKMASSPNSNEITALLIDQDEKYVV